MRFTRLDAVKTPSTTTRYSWSMPLSCSGEVVAPKHPRVHVEYLVYGMCVLQPVCSPVTIMQELGWTMFLMLVKGYIPKLSLGVSNQLLPLMQVILFWFPFFFYNLREDFWRTLQ